MVVLILSMIFFTFILWFRKQKRRMTHFKRLGIPGPPPNFITGNMKEIDEKGLGKCHQEWIEKYGKIVGYYIGCRPFILTSDIDLLKLIQIKHFHSFSDRKVVVPGGTLPTTITKHSVVTNRGEKWKRTRSIITPSFTSGKLKQMYHHIDKSVDDFLQLVKQSYNVIDIHKMYTKLSLEVIGKTAFGIKSDVQYNSNNRFVLDSEAALSYDLSNRFLRMLVYFPEIAPIVSYVRRSLDYLLYLLKLPSTAGIYKIVADVIEARKCSKQKKCDLIQLMIDNRISSEELKTADILTLAADSTSTNDKKESPSLENEKSESYCMTDIEIQANAVLFLLAGHHTTSACLSYTTFLLSTHQNIQENLRQDLLNIIQDKEELTYYDIMNSSYLDQVVSESLRIYPPVISFVTRKSDTEFHYKDYIFPKESAFQAAVWVLHRDPEFWEEPLSFKPERFSPENRSKINLSYQPFGAGPRNCVGMRFALLEIKLVLAKLLLSYRIFPSSQTSLDVDYKVSLTAPKSGMSVRLVPLSIQPQS